MMGRSNLFFLITVIGLWLKTSDGVKMSFTEYDDPIKCMDECGDNGVCLKANLGENAVDKRWLCNCINGYFGRHCKEHPCDKNPCQNGGKCVPAEIDGRYDHHGMFIMNRMPSLIYKMIESTYAQNVVQGYKCECNEGFPGQHCEAKAVCKNLHAGVRDDDTDYVSCSNVGKCEQSESGEVSCTCKSGHTGTRCEVFEACQNHACSNGFPCLPLFGAGSELMKNHTCACENNKNHCKEYDINECQIRHNCDKQYGTCVNTVGSFKCVCNEGFIGDGVTCGDNDECTSGDSKCDKNAICKNTFGSHECTCITGYSGDGIQCDDVDECIEGTHTCSKDGTCTNTVGSFTCACNEGYSGDGFDCTDDDECKENTDKCHENGICTNNPGSYSCECKTGYEGDGFQCADIDECERGTHDCHKEATCTNTPGSFECACNIGWSGSGTDCKDINECEDGSNKCHSDATCTNSAGSYSCSCNTGFAGDGFKCEDINECEVGTDNCDINAECSNLIGSFVCACNIGYSGNGFFCLDVDECKGDHGCHSNALCFNSEGSYECRCNNGYEGDGRQCVDIDECERGTDNCDRSSATCINTVGGFNCQSSVNLNFAIQFSDRTRTEDIPIMRRVRNPSTTGITMCTWLKLSQFPDSNARSLFQFMIEQTIKGFQVWIHSRPRPKLEVQIGGHDVVNIPLKTQWTKQWTHLCILWNKGVMFGYVNGDKIRTPYYTGMRTFPGSGNGNIILGQNSNDRNINFGIRNANRAFQGLISHFMLWHYALSDEEIKNAFNKRPVLSKTITSWDKWVNRARGGTVRKMSFRKKTEAESGSSVEEIKKN